MNVAEESTRSVWMDVRLAHAPALDRAATADVAVIGSGIAGLSVAYEISRQGRSVVVLDRGRLGGGMTARTTAHLASALDDGYAQMIDAHGLEMAMRLHDSLVAAIDRMETIQATEEIACDFRRVPGFLMLAPTSPDSELDDELAACAKIGVPVEESPALAALAGMDPVRALRFPGQARVHPLKYLAGLAAAVKRNGGRLHGNTRVDSVEERETGVVIRTESGHVVRAQDAVIATNSPVNDMAAIHTKQAPYRTYAIAAPLPRGNLDDALYWDTLDPYHYVRLQPAGEHELVIVGGEDHKSGNADDGEARFATLERWARERLPRMGKVSHRWSGQVLEPIDFAGFVGRNPGSERVYVATGDSGQGITNGAIAGMLIADLIETGTSPWAAVYDPARKVKKRLGEFVSENATALKNAAEYLTAGDIASAESLAPGEGKLLRSGLQTIAACRDRNGRLHLRSASCTHLGCVVHFNSLEQCWDCPCHGSQFAPDGTALNGPAIAPLGAVGEGGKLAAAE